MSERTMVDLDAAVGVQGIGLVLMNMQHKKKTTGRMCFYSGTSIQKQLMIEHCKRKQKSVELKRGAPD